MKALGVPFVIQCAWRSFFPEIYNVRVTFWDSPLCSPFIGRMLATIGEVTWMAQISLGLIWCDRELRTLQKFRKSKIVENTKTYKNLAILAVVLTFIAEFFCNYGMFTLDYSSNVVETSLWTIALALVFPYACNLMRRAKEI